MSDNERDATANLEFFTSAILEPALEDQQSFGSAENVSVSNFGAIEAALWLRLGVQIGYFNAKRANQLISQLTQVYTAWQDLSSRGIISPDDDWAHIIRLGETGQVELNEETFSESRAIAPETRSLLHSTFQTFLLLTAENILDSDSRYFLDNIGWASDRDWNAHRTGTDSLQSGSAAEIERGFANVLNYWSEMKSTSDSAPFGFAELHPPITRSQPTPPYDAGHWKAAQHTVQKFIQDARSILSKRFNLGQTKIVRRYFTLASEFANRAREDSAAWLDARLRVFEKLTSLISYAGGEASLRGDWTRFWNLFTLGVENSPTAAAPYVSPEQSSAQAALGEAREYLKRIEETPKAKPKGEPEKLL